MGFWVGQPGTRFPAVAETLFLSDMSNRVEHQKLNQMATDRLLGRVFGIQLRPTADTGSD